MNAPQRMSARKVTLLGLLTAVALVLGWLESSIPMPAAIAAPGIKLGIANTVLLYAIYMLNARSAALLMALKVLLSGFLYAGPSAMIYSFAGGITSLAVMLLTKRIPRVHIVIVSVCGAVAHNIGQLVAVGYAVGWRFAFAYAPVLLIAGAIAGFLTGIVATYVLRGLKIADRKEKEKRHQE